MSDNGNWLSHGFKRVPSLFETQAALGWGVVVALLALLGVVYLAQARQIIASGYNMQKWTAELKELQEQNTYLEDQIAAGQPIEHLQARARELGFVPARPEDIEYLVVENYPPTPGQAAGAAAQTPEPPGGVGRWWSGLARGFTGWTQSTAGGGY